MQCCMHMSKSRLWLRHQKGMFLSSNELQHDAELDHWSLKTINIETETAPRKAKSKEWLFPLLKEKLCPHKRGKRPQSLGIIVFLVA